MYKQYRTARGLLIGVLLIIAACICSIVGRCQDNKSFNLSGYKVYVMNLQTNQSDSFNCEFNLYLNSPQKYTVLYFKGNKPIIDTIATSAVDYRTNEVGLVMLSGKEMFLSKKFFSVTTADKKLLFIFKLSNNF